MDTHTHTHTPVDLGNDFSVGFVSSITTLQVITFRGRASKQGTCVLVTGSNSFHVSICREPERTVSMLGELFGGLKVESRHVFLLPHPPILFANGVSIKNIKTSRQLKGAIGRE